MPDPMKMIESKDSNPSQQLFQNKKVRLTEDDSLTKSKQLLEKINQKKRNRSKASVLKNKKTRLCGFRKPFPSLLDLEKMFEDSDNDNESMTTTVTTTLISETKIPNDTIPTPSAINTIADKIFNYISNKPETTSILDENTPSSVILQKNRQNDESIPQNEAKKIQVSESVFNANSNDISSRHMNREDSHIEGSLNITRNNNCTFNQESQSFSYKEGSMNIKNIEGNNNCTSNPEPQSLSHREGSMAIVRNYNGTSNREPHSVSHEKVSMNIEEHNNCISNQEPQSVSYRHGSMIIEESINCTSNQEPQSVSHREESMIIEENNSFTSNQEPQPVSHREGSMIIEENNSCTSNQEPQSLSHMERSITIVKNSDCTSNPQPQSFSRKGSVTIVRKNNCTSNREPQSFSHREGSMTIVRNNNRTSNRGLQSLFQKKGSMATVKNHNRTLNRKYQSFSHRKRSMNIKNNEKCIHCTSYWDPQSCCHRKKSMNIVRNNYCTSYQEPHSLCHKERSMNIVNHNYCTLYWEPQSCCHRERSINILRNNYCSSNWELQSCCHRDRSMNVVRNNYCTSYWEPQSFCHMVRSMNIERNNYSTSNWEPHLSCHRERSNNLVRHNYCTSYREPQICCHRKRSMTIAKNNYCTSNCEPKLFFHSPSTFHEQCFNESIDCVTCTNNHNNYQHDVEIVEEPYDTIIIDDTPRSPQPIEINNWSVPTDVGCIHIENNNETVLRSPIPVNNFLDIHENQNDITEIIDVDRMITGNRSITSIGATNTNIVPDIIEVNDVRSETTLQLNQTLILPNIVDFNSDSDVGEPVTLPVETNNANPQNVDNRVVNVTLPDGNSRLTITSRGPRVTNICRPSQSGNTVQFVTKISNGNRVTCVVNNTNVTDQSLRTNDSHNLVLGLQNELSIFVEDGCSNQKSSKTKNQSPQSPNKLESESDTFQRKIGECPVCMDSLSNKTVASTLCGHIFCMNCIQAALRANGKKCPTCRMKLKGNGYHQIFL